MTTSKTTVISHWWERSRRDDGFSCRYPMQCECNQNIKTHQGRYIPCWPVLWSNSKWRGKHRLLTSFTDLIQFSSLMTNRHTFSKTVAKLVCSTLLLIIYVRSFPASSSQASGPLITIYGTFTIELEMISNRPCCHALTAAPTAATLAKTGRRSLRDMASAWLSTIPINASESSRRSRAELTMAWSWF